MYVRVWYMHAKQCAAMHGQAKNAINCTNEFNENKNGLFGIVQNIESVLKVYRCVNVLSIPTS